MAWVTPDDYFLYKRAAIAEGSPHVPTTATDQPIDNVVELAAKHADMMRFDATTGYFVSALDPTDQARRYATKFGTQPAPALALEREISK